MSYDRYARFRTAGNIKAVPFIEIPKKDTDRYVEYDPNRNRLDLVSYDYYGDANYGWLILQANPELGSLEFRIRRNETIRVPFPLETSLIQYVEGIKQYEKLYGIE